MIGAGGGGDDGAGGGDDGAGGGDDGCEGGRGTTESRTGHTKDRTYNHVICGMSRGEVIGKIGPLRITFRTMQARRQRISFNVLRQQQGVCVTLCSM